MGTLLARYLRHRFAWLFVSLLVTIGLNPVLEAILRFDPLELLLIVNLLAAIASAASERWFRRLALLGAAYLVTRAFAALGVGSMQPISRVAWLAVIVLAAVATARHALRAGRVDADHLFAALDTYLLVGLIFAVGFSLLDQLSPGSFGAPLGGGDLGIGHAVYFSFVTLATLGYGDIVPVSDIARGLAILEAVIGQLYLAVLVARLVSLYSQQPRS